MPQVAEPGISVLIPTFNRRRMVERCLTSVCSAQFRNLEIIVYDNSQDGTDDVVREFQRRDDRIVLVHELPNRGPLNAWKSCLALARNEYVHWLWSDDWIEPDFYSRLWGAMKATHTQVACCSAAIVDEDNNARAFTFPLSLKAHSSGDVVIHFINRRRPLLSPAAYLLPRTTCLEALQTPIPKSRGIDCDMRAIGPDLLMIIHSAFKCGGFCAIPEPLVNFSKHTSSVSTQSGGDVLAVHYAWSRLCWSTSVGVPFSSGFRDLLTLAKRGKFVALAELLTSRLERLFNNSIMHRTG